MLLYMGFYNIIKLDQFIFISIHRRHWLKLNQV